VEALIRDFEQDFRTRLPFWETRQILILYEELCELREIRKSPIFVKFLLIEPEVLTA
jgi:hypothetical protein